ncbi:MAG TPA: hypothetical protein PKY78_08525 [Candidatus Omnitrophota bacterium]|nr:hypothetical protein [Candidatus Omnitrophota bacterium]
MDIFSFCKCSSNGICLPCRVLTIVVLAVITAVLIGVYLRRKK